MKICQSVATGKRNRTNRQSDARFCQQCCKKKVAFHNECEFCKINAEQADYVMVCRLQNWPPDTFSR